MRISDLEELMGMPTSTAPAGTPQTGVSPQQAAAQAVQQQRQQKDAVANMIKQRDMLKKQLMDLEKQIRDAQTRRVGPQ
jgi:hypothetical protein